MNRKSYWIVLLSGLILGLAFSPLPARAWQTHNGPGAQTVPTAPPTPPTPTITQTSSGGSQPQPAPSETAPAYQPPAAATQAEAGLTPYPLAGATLEAPSAYPLTSPGAPTSAGEMEPSVTGESGAVMTRTPAAAVSGTPVLTPQATTGGWVGYAAGALVLAAVLGLFVLWRRNAGSG